MSYTDRDRTLAFAGLYQAVRQVHDLAAHGRLHPQAFETSLNSLFVTEPDTTLDVFGGRLENLRLGLETLLGQMLGSQRNMHITRYALGLMILAKKVMQDHERLQRISATIETAQRQQTHFGGLERPVLETLARAYEENISPLQPRILVNGLPEHLKDPLNVVRIRALLLAGLRAAILWYQTGGSRFKLIFRRGVYVRTARQLLSELPEKPRFSPEQH